MSRTGPALAVVAAVTVAACASGPQTWSDVGGAATAEMDIHEQTVRFAVRYYEPSRRGPPAAFCLAVGRRSINAVSEVRRARGEIWIPGHRLIARLSDLRPAVVPGSECDQDADRREVHRPSGGQGVLIHVSEPAYSSPERATVRLSTNESPQYRFSYRCELRREALDWTVVRCL
jgi:hypothetical protein